MKKYVEFNGMPSGDGESFCWAVTPEIFKNIVGREPNGWDYTDQEWNCDDEGEAIFTNLSETVKLYPDYIFSKEKPFERYGNLKIKIEFEEI
jgi:hypothetical protein